MATETAIRLRFTPEMTRTSHGEWMAVCKEFRQAASGATEQEARVRLRQIVESFCNALKRQEGLLEKALRESGISWHVESVNAEEIVLTLQS